MARSPIPWFGGKQRLAPWIVSHLPEHDTYCEPFGGAASVILAKQPSQRDVYNDLDGGVANFFRIVRDRSDELVRRILLSPYHRGEYFAALDGMDEHPDDMERARRFYVVAHQSFSALFGKSWARSSSEARGWGTRCLADLYLCADRLRSVIVENRPAAKVIELEDSPATAFYCDPPYLPETRKSSGEYRCEMTAEQHAALLDQLNSVHGAVLLSGYPHASYERSLRGWKRITRSVFAYSSSWQHRGQTELAKRTECLWIKPASRPSRPTGRPAHSSLRPCPQKPTGAPTERVVPRPSKRPCRPVPTAVRRSSRLSLARNLHGRSKPPRHRE